MEHLIQKIDKLTEERNVLMGLLAASVVVAGGEIIIGKHHQEAGFKPEDWTFEMVTRPSDEAIVLRASRKGWRT